MCISSASTTSLETWLTPARMTSRSSWTSSAIAARPCWQRETLAALGTTILAITDGPLSPLAALTDHWCQLAVPAVGPFDSSVPAVTAAELLVGQVARDLKGHARDRIDRTELLWESTGTFHS